MAQLLNEKDMKKRSNYYIVFSLFLVLLNLVLVFYSCNNIENKKTDVKFYNSVVDTTFYPSGNIWSLTPRLENGQRHGLKRRYFENGNLEFKQTYYEDKQIGSEYWYFEDGNLAFYSVRNSEDSVFFFLQLDSLGHTIEKAGAIISPKYEIDGDSDTLQLNKTYRIRFLYADPKIYTFNLDSVILSVDKSKKQFKNYSIKKEKGEIIFEFKPQQKGSQKLILYSSLNNNKGVRFCNDLDIPLYIK